MKVLYKQRGAFPLQDSSFSLWLLCQVQTLSIAACLTSQRRQTGRAVCSLLWEEDTASVEPEDPCGLWFFRQWIQRILWLIWHYSWTWNYSHMKVVECVWSFGPAFWSLSRWLTCNLEKLWWWMRRRIITRDSRKALNIWGTGSGVHVEEGMLCIITGRARWFMARSEPCFLSHGVFCSVSSSVNLLEPFAWFKSCLNE